MSRLPDLPATTGEAVVTVDASSSDVYALVADIERMGEWSPETFRARWRRGATAAVAGARFRGWNRRGLQIWPTDVIIETAEPGEQLSFVTSFFGFGRFTRWTYRFADAGDGAITLSESWEQVGAVPGFTKRFLSPDRVAQLHAGMVETLGRIKAAAERA